MRRTRIRYDASPTKFSWIKAVLLLVLVLIVGLAVYTGFLYKSTMAGKTKGTAHAKAEALKKTELTKADKVERFDGENTYRIVYGKTKNNKKAIVFLPTNKKKKPVVIDQADIVSKEKVLADWQKNCASCELKKAGPAMIQDKPLWEITYRDNAARYVFEYVSMYDGEIEEQFSLSNMYK